jgi:hypothetical protein
LCFGEDARKLYLIQYIIYEMGEQMRYITDRLKLQSADAKAWVLQAIIIAVVLGAFWVPELLK